ncbi:ABC transporter ATP-binding protein [Geminocystis herdmanii]|uniref:ABC transporter ATP-binding protein n=1 Tax=Geminocystis herdmanii TaxID=669359 RepID=UPI0003457BF0|nr:ABC transporter ATP-binding protein [Geminocystis herdmanii]
MEQEIRSNLNDSILIANNLSKSFGGLKAVNNASIEVKANSITGLIGPNGAGKSTLFNLLSNFLKADTGKVLFEGKPVQNLNPHEIAREGFIRTFQVARVLSRLTVLENMLLGSQKQTGENIFSVLINQGKIRREEKENKAKAMNILESVGLAEKAYDYAGALSGGQRKLLEMARTLMTNPKLILLDEPAAGVNPTLINQICQHIVNWNQQGISFLIIEHNMDVIMSLCSHVWVLAEGTNLADGTPEEIQGDDRVLEAYLGG